MPVEYDVAFQDEYIPTWRDRLRWWLFPITHCELPEVPSVAATKDCITIHTLCELSFSDRLRLLFTGRLEVTTRTVTQNEVGHNFTSSACYPLGPKWMER